jgi:uncharacterized protein YndB with AHSA1/START domain
MIMISAAVEVARPAADVWAIVADYARDPEWRCGVTAMTASGPLAVGMTTDEQMRFVGKRYRNGGVVETVGPDQTFTWRTTSGVEASGRQTVETLNPKRCRLRLETTVVPGGLERLLAPVLGRLLQRNLTGDAARLRTLAEREVHSVAPPP